MDNFGKHTHGDNLPSFVHNSHLCDIQSDFVCPRDIKLEILQITSPVIMDVHQLDFPDVFHHYVIGAEESGAVDISGGVDPESLGERLTLLHHDEKLIVIARSRR